MQPENFRSAAAPNVGYQPQWPERLEGCVAASSWREYATIWPALFAKFSKVASKKPLFCAINYAINGLSFVRINALSLCKTWSLSGSTLILELTLC
jgi:hypothetical protein